MLPQIGVTEILELRMTGSSIREYAKTMRERYWKADCEGKARVLDEFIVLTGYHRKAAIRSLGRVHDLVPKARRGRCRKYGTEVAGALRTAWETSGYLCSKRLHDFMAEWTAMLAQTNDKVQDVLNADQMSIFLYLRHLEAQAMQSWLPKSL